MNPLTEGVVKHDIHGLRLRLKEALDLRATTLSQLCKVDGEIRSISKILSTYRGNMRPLMNNRKLFTRDCSTTSSFRSSHMVTRCSSRERSDVHNLDLEIHTFKTNDETITPCSISALTPAEPEGNREDGSLYAPTGRSVGISYVLPRSSPIDRWMRFVTHFASRPTRPMTVIPKVEDEPRAAHLLPLVPGRAAEDVEKDCTIRFQHRLFKKKGTRDVSRYLSNDAPASADPLIIALFAVSDSFSGDCD